MRAVPETQSLDKQSLKLKNKSSPLTVKPGISGKAIGLYEIFYSKGWIVNFGGRNFY